MYSIIRVNEKLRGKDMYVVKDKTEEPIIVIRVPELENLKYQEKL